MNKDQNNNNTLLKKQKKWILTLIVPVVILLIAALVLPQILKKDPIVTNLPKIDPATGDYLEYYLISSKDGSEVKVTDTADNTVVEAYDDITYSVRTYLYPEIPVTNIKEVSVSNSHGEYAIYLDEGTGNHFLRGHENQLYKQMEFSVLRLQARLMFASERLENVYDTEEKLAPFGLDAASNPVKVTVTDVSGNTHNVYIGKALVSDSGYYAKDDDPYVYVLDSTVSVFLEDANYFIDPALVVPLSQNQYQYAEEFTIYKNGEPFISSAIVSSESQADTSNVSLHNITYPGNYPASMANYYTALETFATLAGDSVIETNVLLNGVENATALFEKYGLTIASNDVSLKYGGVTYRFITGNRFTDEAGNVCYYAYSETFDTIVTLPLANAPFLEYELLDFINSAFFQVNIANVKEIEFKTADKSLLFTLEGTGNNLVVKEKNSGKSVDAASFRQVYFSLLDTKIEGYAGVGDVTGDKELSYTVRTVYGEELKYDFSVISTTRELLTVGTSSQFYTSRSNVTKIIERLDKLMNGEIITPDY